MHLDQPTDRRLMPIGWMLTAILFLVSRLPDLTLAGMMYDENTYIYWGRLIAASWDNRFIGAHTGGREPLHSWLVALSQLIFQDPVFAGRFVSVCIGAVILLAVWLLARRLFSSRVAFMATLLYILCPFTLLYDRSAMTDSLLSASAIWVLYLGLVCVDRVTDRPGPDASPAQHRMALIKTIAAITGLAFAFSAGLLTKWTAGFFVLLLPGSLLLPLRNRPSHLSKKIGQPPLRWLAYAGLGLACGYLVYYFVFGQTDGPAQIAGYQALLQFILPLSQIVTLPWSVWLNTLSIMSQTMLNLVTWPLMLVALAALLCLPKLGRASWIPAVWVIVPLVGYIVVARVFYDRYMLLAIPPWLVLTAAFLDRVSNWASKRVGQAWRWLAPLGLFLVLLPAILTDVSWHTSLETANHDNVGYYGINLLRDDFQARSVTRPADQTVYIVTSNALTPFSGGSFDLLSTVPGIKVLRLTPNFDFSYKYHIFDPLNNMAYGTDCFKNETVYVVDDADTANVSPYPARLKLQSTYSNRRGDASAVGLYQVAFDESLLSKDCTGQIELAVHGNGVGLQSVVQWQDGTGAWQDIDNWKSDLSANEPVRWWIEAKDFGKGPFRWGAFKSDHPLPVAVSQPFYMPDKTHLKETISLQAP
jgi:4-amino-4-deoxy-L-arabinose transferase-like glycosyltransferase